MGPEHLVTDRETLRERPPHILLTNYKMLDFLMIRPVDRRLWRHNQPSTLPYQVMHAVDGPQGTDLACHPAAAARQAPVHEGLICVGTSATVGGESAELRQHTADVFDQAFDEHAIPRHCVTILHSVSMSTIRTIRRP